MERRKVTFKLYPKAEQAERQQNVLPEIKAARPELAELVSHALQQTLRKLDLAFQAFFRRVKAGQAPGFPRFKAHQRFAGFAYPDPAGWKLLQEGKRGGTLRIGSGQSAMTIRLRGKHRFDNAKPNDLTVIRKHGEWFASVTLRVAETACARERTDHQHRGVDFGLLVRTCALLATEELEPKNMCRSARGTLDKPGRMVRQKAGLNREILGGAGHGASDALVQSGRGWYEITPEPHAPVKTLATLRKMLGRCAQNTRAA